MIVRDRKVPTEPGLQVEPLEGWQGGARDSPSRSPCHLQFVTLRAFVSLLAAVIITGCTGAPGTSRPRTTPRPAAEVVPSDPLRLPWLVSRAAAPVEQIIHVAAILESRTDSLSPARVDTLQSQLVVTWSSPSIRYPLRFVGSVTDYRIGTAAGDSLERVAELPLPFSFSAEQRDRTMQAAFSSPVAAECATPQASVVHGVRDLWLSLPDTLSPGRTWKDSTTYVVCRDSIPLTMRVEREFRVTGAAWKDSVVVATIERRTVTRLSGNGLQFGEPISIRGEGTGSVMFEVSLSTGIALFASGESVLELSMTGRRRSQQLTQRSRISILER